MIRHAEASRRDRSAGTDRDTAETRGAAPRRRSSAASLQRSIGNRGLQAAFETVAVDDGHLHLRTADRSAGSAATEGVSLSAGRSVSRPSDPAEREARRIAERVRRSETGSGPARRPGKTPAGDLAADGPQLSPQATASTAAGPSASGALTGELDRAHGRPLPHTLRADFEPRFGTDFGDVRLHTGDRAGRLARQLDAAAFTHGSDVFVRPDRYQPDSADGRALLAHELTHVVQARSGAADASIHRAAARQTADGSSPVPPRRETEYRVRCDEDVYRVRIRGHASPRWRHPRPKTPAERNLALSWERARAVENAIRNLFLQRLGTGGGARFGFQCVADEHASSLEATAVGSTQTIEEAGGDTSANDPELRRVDVLVEAERTVQTTTERERTRELPTRTNQWAVRVFAVEAAGYGGGAGSGGLAELKNRKTGQRVSGGWVAGGFGGGVELPIPAAAPDPEWADFETTKPLTFEDFQGTDVRFIHVDVGIGAAGYSWAYISFDDYMGAGVSVSGFVMNQWGVGGTATWGKWGFTDRIPDPPTETETVEVTSTHNVGTSYGHQVFFPTESSQIPGDELARLRQFVNSIP